MNFSARKAILAATILLFATASCDSDKTDPKDAAEDVVQTLQGLPEGPSRDAISALTFNTMCTIQRLATGQADGRVEMSVAPLLNTQPEMIKQRLAVSGDVLDQIPSGVRAELLGDLGSFDPGACDAAPDWDRLRHGILFNHQPIPHLRANFCSNNLTYADGETADRAITVGSVLTEIQQFEPNTPPHHLLASSATPSLTGIEKSEFVSARHPGLDATGDAGEGLTPYGFKTDIPCSTNAICDRSLGMICRTDTCVAYPVVQKDQTMVLRGYNFWDVAEARVVFEPFEPGQGSESTSVIATFDANEPTDQVAACALPSTISATFNRAHFRVPANEGHFYRVRMFNHNGQFLTQQDGVEDGDSRVIHTCFPPSSPNVTDNVPPGTVRDCTPPVETCVQDGAPCAATWATPPRKLEECRHLPGQPSPCGETPEWYEAQMLSPRSDGAAVAREAIVFVEAEAPVFELKGTVHAVEAVEETGIDFPGSDEPMMAIIGVDLTGKVEIPNLDDLAIRFLGEDYDEGDRKIEDVFLTSVDLPVDGSAAFLAVFSEDDARAGLLAAGILAIGIATAIVVLSGGVALISALGGLSIAVFWGLIVEVYLEENDTIGWEIFSASPLQVLERIGATHADNFLTTQPPAFGPLPPHPDEPGKDARAGKLIHPFVEFTFDEFPLQAQCNPGSCSPSQQCLVNRCVPADFIDPTANTGFRERREYTGSGGYYAVDMQWEMLQK